jgi:hypothetical protein
MSFILKGKLPPERTFRKPSYQGLKHFSNQIFSFPEAGQTFLISTQNTESSTMETTVNSLSAKVPVV